MSGLYYRQGKIKSIKDSQKLLNTLFKNSNLLLIISKNIWNGSKPIINKTANNNKLPTKKVCQ